MSIANRRSDKNRAQKYRTRATAMLDRFHWTRGESHFLALVESEALTIAEIRTLTWAHLQDRYEGLFVLNRAISLREGFFEDIRTCLKEGKGFYGEELYGSEGIPRLFTKKMLKSIIKEMDQFKI